MLVAYGHVEAAIPLEDCNMSLSSLQDLPFIFSNPRRLGSN